MTIRAFSHLCKFVSFRLFLVASANAQDLQQTQAALDIISKFATSLCDSVEAKGRNEAWEASASAKANLNGVVKRLADLGAQGATKYSQQQYEGVLQTDLSNILKSQADCRLAVFRELKGKLLSGGNPEQGSAGSAQISAKLLVLGGFGNTVEELQSKGLNVALHKDTDTGGLFIRYSEPFQGEQYDVAQDLNSQGKTGRARAWFEITGMDSNDKFSGASEYTTTNLCSTGRFSALLSGLTRTYGTPHDIKERTEDSKNSEEDRVERYTATSQSGASWVFPDKSRLLLYVHGYNGTRDYYSHHDHFWGCKVEMCAIPAGAGPCFTVPGLSV